uniref:DNA processing protein A n=1 Tax=Clandestinovirus TaxID=2831644 RepID=A0A8F8KNV2_9VIRU|nr:DNA processing protein A [Clandestinovirus]
MAEKKYAIVGAREFNDYDKLTAKVDEFIAKFGTPDVIISGGAKGADTLGERYAKEKGIKFQCLLPDWNKHGKIAGILRNTDIVNQSTHILAFISGPSRGTRDTINKGIKAKKHVEVYE